MESGGIVIGNVVIVRPGARLRVHAGTDPVGRPTKDPFGVGDLPLPESAPGGPSDSVPMQVHAFVARARNGAVFLTTSQEGVAVERVASIPPPAWGEPGKGGLSFVSAPLDDVEDVYVLPDTFSDLGEEALRMMEVALGGGSRH